MTENGSKDSGQTSPVEGAVVTVSYVLEIARPALYKPLHLETIKMRSYHCNYLGSLMLSVQL
jgi:hypothetical protein